jgi:ribosomal protein L7/L12
VSKRFDKNSPVEDLLSYLRQGGIPAIPTIKLLQELYGMDLKDAKTTFENSKTWADKKPERDKFYETVAEALNIMEKESEDEND